MQKTDVVGVYQRKDGRFVVRATAKDPTGQIVERQRTLRKGATLQEAIERREVLKEQIRTPEPTDADPMAHIITVGDYAEHWLEEKAAALKPSTAEMYHTVLVDRVLPVLADVPVRELTRAHAQRWVAWADRQDKPEKRGGGTYSRETRMSWWRVTRQILMDAKADFALRQNPCERVRPPKRDGGNHRTGRSLSLPELAKFLSAFEARYENRYPEVAVLASTGMRAGELYALHWSDIDWNEGTITVQRSAPKGVLTHTTKTGAPREVYLFPKVAELLRSHQREQFATDGAHELVFPADNGEVRFSSSIRKCMATVSKGCKWLEFGVTPQVLRRTVNTLGRQHGHSEEALRKAMGHTDVEMTDHYHGSNFDDIKGVMTDAVGLVFG